MTRSRTSASRARSRAALVLATLLLTLGTGTADAGEPQGVSVRLATVASGFDAPVAVRHAGDGSGRLFVVEQGGRIRIVRGGTVLAMPFLDISARVQSGGEQGLLGLAFHPRYERNGRFYVFYTANDDDHVISEFRRSRNADRASPSSERVVLRFPDFASNHNGGDIHFGPRDGYLYIADGDGGGGGDPRETGQRLNTLLGKILRIDVNGRANGQYSIPSSNPFVGRRGARGEIWSYGLRNPWRFSFDRETGDLWIGDVGQNAYEEIDRSRVGQGAGRGVNWGWDVMEGFACYEPSSGCDRTGKTLPIAAYGRSEGSTVTGGFVYRGRRYPSLVGKYVFADFGSGRIWSLAAAGPSRQTPVLLADTNTNLSSFGESEAGEHFAVDLFSGRLYRIVGS